MEKTTILQAVGAPSASQEQLVTSVSYSAGLLSIMVQTHSPDDGEWEVAFKCPVGFRVLGESDTPEFWHISVDIIGDNQHAIVYEVTKGGWIDQQMPHSPIMAAGFYSQLKEYWVGGCADCVNVLSESPPAISRRASMSAA